MLIKVTTHVNVLWGLSTTKLVHSHAHGPELKGRSAAPSASGCTVGTGQTWAERDFRQPAQHCVRFSWTFLQLWLRKYVFFKTPCLLWSQKLLQNHVTPPMKRATSHQHLGAASERRKTSSKDAGLHISWVFCQHNHAQESHIPEEAIKIINNSNKTYYLKEKGRKQTRFSAGDKKNLFLI